jgi:hypothetical protein
MQKVKRVKPSILNCKCTPRQLSVFSKHYEIYEIDGCFSKIIKWKQKRCDYLLFKRDGKPILILIELKSRDRIKAIEQLEGCAQIFRKHCAFWATAKKAFCFLGKSTGVLRPKSPPKIEGTPVIITTNATRLKTQLQTLNLI